MMDDKNIVDDQGTNQKEAREMLIELCEKEFSGSIGELALALGRNYEDISELLGGEGIIDDDLAMKIRGLALQSGTDIE